MKKLIFLLILAVAVVGLMPALDAAHPPGALALDAAMPGYDVYEAAITPDTVSADTLFERPAGFLAFPDFYMVDVPAGQSERYPLIKPIVVGQGVFIPPKVAGVYLRL